MNPQYYKTFSKFCSNRDYVFDLNLFKLTGYMDLTLVKWIISRHILWNVGCDFFLKEQRKTEEWQK